MSYIKLKIDQILLDEDNPRITSVENQRDALKKIIKDQDKKLAVLAKDMLDHGLSPIEITLVTKSKSQKNKYVVLEGNRRLAVLKILNNPQVLQSLEMGPTLRKRLEKLSESFNKKLFEPLFCFEVDTKHSGQHWIELKHNGEDKGRGTVRWSPLVAARFRGETPAVQALELLKEKSDLSEDELEKVESAKFPLTTLDRILGAVGVRERIGLDIKNGVLYTNIAQSEVLKPLKRIVLDLAYKKINVSRVKSVKQMLAYISKFEESDTADTSKKTRSKARAARSKKAATKKTKSRPKSKRASVIPDDIDYEIENARTEKIFEELKALDLNVYQNACGILLRIFLEFSLVHYMQKKKMSLNYEKGKNKGKKKSLNDMMSSVINHMVDNDLSLEADFKFLRQSVTQKKSPLYVGLLNEFVHNRYYAPTADDLRTTWDNSQPLFDAIWS